MKMIGNLSQPSSGSSADRPRRSAGKSAGPEESGTRAPARVRMKRILVPVDFSEASLKALRYAVAFAEQFRATLFLVHIVEPASFVNDLGNVSLTLSDRETANRLHHKLVMLGRRLVRPSVPVKPLVCIGKPFYEIVGVAQTFDVDLIIIATQGHTGVKRALLGSTAERVVRHAPCPVLVVREQEQHCPASQPPPSGKEL